MKQQVVLVRSSHDSDQLEVELSSRNIPYKKYGGLKFLESAHVKDLLSVLRFCVNPRNRIAGSRVFELLPGIGSTTAAKILDEIDAEGGKVIRVLKRFAVPKQAAEDWPALVKLIARLRQTENWPAEFELLRTWYEPHLQRLHDDAEIRAADIVQLQQIAGGYRSRERFLTELTLDPPESTSGDAHANQLDEDYVILATIHWAKGGEWKIVRVLSVVEGSIPAGLATRTANEIEKERRLLHVAMTRAEDELDLIVPQRVYQRKGEDAGYVNSKMSRFIPNSIHHAFESKHWGERSSELNVGRSKWRSKRIDVASSVEEMWR